jgi:hypothetical protein
VSSNAAVTAFVAQRVSSTGRQNSKEGKITLQTFSCPNSCFNMYFTATVAFIKLTSPPSYSHWLPVSKEVCSMSCPTNCLDKIMQIVYKNILSSAQKPESINNHGFTIYNDLNTILYCRCI